MVSKYDFLSQDDTRKWVKTLTKEFIRPCVVLLCGELGAGKTQVVRWILEDLKVKESSSPTFSILNHYTVNDESIDHVDLYRIQSDSDLESSGFWDLFKQPNGLVFVEWADRLPSSVWPLKWRKVFISIARGSLSEQRKIMVDIR